MSPVQCALAGGARKPAARPGVPYPPGQTGGRSGSYVAVALKLGARAGIGSELGNPGYAGCKPRVSITRSPRNPARRQENLDGQTVARLAAVHGTRPNPAGPAPAFQKRHLQSGSFSGSFGGSFRGSFGGSFRGSLNLGAGLRRRSLGAVCDEDGQTGDADIGGAGAVRDALVEWWHPDPTRRPVAAGAAQLLERAAAAAAAAAAAVETAESSASDRQRRRSSMSSSTSLPPSASFLLTPRQRGSFSSLDNDAPREQLPCAHAQGAEGVRSLSNETSPRSEGGGGDGASWNGGQGRRILTWLCWGSDRAAGE